MDKPSLLNAIEALKTATGVNSVTPEVLASIYENIILILEENIDGKYSEFSSLKSSFNNFLSSADTSNSTINRWKEIETFLQGITDTDTLIGLLEELHSRMTSELESVEDFLVSNFALKSELVEGISQSRKEESQIKVLVETEKERITQEIEQRQNIIREIQPKLLKGYLYVKNMDSTNTNFRLFTDSSKTTEFISNYVGGEVGSLWRVSGDVAGLLISGWHHLTLICSNYILRFYYTDENGEVLPTTSTSGGYWRKTIRFTYHTYEEQSSWNKVVEDFNTFLKSADTSDATINRWKEIEVFLKGITDTQTLTGLLEALRKDLQANIDGNTTLINEETTRTTQAERLLQADIDFANARTANILQLSSVAEADVLSYLALSTMYIVEGGKAIILLDVKGAAVGKVTQTLIKDGDMLYRYNIKQVPINGNTDASYWSEWSDKKASPIINWSTSFNMNDYKAQGVYYITGERLQSENDNLPIMNASSGHTISGQLTVLDASLSDTEQCITQYLKLTNRLGSEGKEYIRTYNKYSNGSEGWSAWRELKQTTNLNQISDAELKNYTENGMYEGVIVGSISSLNNITKVIENFLSTASTSGGAEDIPTGTLFKMDVLNNYAVVQKVEEWGFGVIPRSVTQRAKALLITGQYVEIQRTLQGDVWSGWKIVNHI